MTLKISHATNEQTDKQMDRQRRNRRTSPWPKNVKTLHLRAVALDTICPHQLSHGIALAENHIFSVANPHQCVILTYRTAQSSDDTIRMHTCCRHRAKSGNSDRSRTNTRRRSRIRRNPLTPD